MSQLLYAKIGKDGKNIGLELLCQLFGISLPMERRVFESMINACAEDWTIMNPSLALALICVTDDVKLRSSEQYQWPEIISLGDLTWHPYRLLDKRQVKGQTKWLYMCIHEYLNRHNIAMIGPPINHDSNYALLVLEHASDDKLKALEAQWSIICSPMRIDEMVRPFVSQA